MIRILLADDSITVRQKLQYMLEPEADFEIVGTADSGEKTVELVGTLKPDVVLIDIEMPGLDGLGATQQISRRYPDVKVLILSSYGDEKYIDQALKKGARGYLLKNTPASELFHAIRFVQKGYLQLGPGLFEKYSAHTAKQSFEQPVIPTALSDKDPAPLESSVPQPAQPVGVPIEASALVPAITSSPVPTKSGAIAPMPERPVTVEVFDRPVILRQSPKWSRAIVWLIMTVAALATAWAFIFQIEEAVPAQGKLEPTGAVKDIQTPVGGVVKEVLVKDGDSVKKGQLLIKMDPKSAQSELVQRKKQLEELQKINQYYQQEMSGRSNTALEAEINPTLTRTTKDREELIQENQVLAAMIDPSISVTSFSPAQRARIQERRQLAISNARDPQFDFQKSNDREAQFQAQLDQIQAQQRENLSQQKDQQQRIDSAQATFEFEQDTFVKIKDAFDKGAIAGLQFTRQQDTVQQAESEFMSRKSQLNQIKEQYQRLEDQKREIQQRISENQKDRDQSVNRGDIGRSSNNSELQNQIAANNQRVAEIEANLTKTIRENEQRIADLKNSISQALLTMQYQELRSPVDGQVFDLQVGDNSVANASEPLLKVVPSDNLEAKLFVTNKDIGFLQNNYIVRQEKNESLPVDIRIDSFPYSEYGDVKGSIAWIGSDALAPNEERPFYHFPVKVKLDAQKLKVRKSDKQLSLQSGMSISASIKVRDRPIISLITDGFTQQLENLKYLRD